MNTEIHKIKLQINITKCQWSKINKRQSKPKGQSRMDNPEKLATLGTHDTGQRLEKTERAIKNGQSKETGNLGYT